MRTPPRNPTETSLGSHNERDDLLWMQTHNSRVLRWVRAVCKAVLVLSILALAAVTVVGPAQTVEWAVAYLMPVGAVACVAAVVLGLLAWALGKSPTSPNRDRWR